MSQGCAIDDERGGLLDELTAGFEALMLKAEELTETNSHLLECVKHFQKDPHRLTPDKSLSVSSDFPELASIQPEARWNWQRDIKINKGIQACKLLKISTMPAVPLRRNTSGIREGKGQASQDQNAAQPQDTFGAEKDFTTEGPKGDLRCPFSRTVTANDIVNETKDSVSYREAVSFPDPIAAEFHESEQVKAPSVAASASKCPIRFMDHHSPEEVAKYFENHKHEIPRSHEICVKRYQANEASIRSLDAKYGSLIKMIQGLGEMHKPMLPAKSERSGDGDEARSADDKSRGSIEKWAQTLPDDQTQPAVANATVDEIEPDEAESDQRTSHFKRPLREVRLGESPSRPWGIQVPYSEQRALSSAHDVSKAAAAVPSSVAVPPADPTHDNPAPQGASKCPFHNLMPQTTQTIDLPTEPRNISNEPQNEAQVLKTLAAIRTTDPSPPQIVFNGPVFFGYPAESAASLMKSLGKQ